MENDNFGRVVISNENNIRTVKYSGYVVRRVTKDGGFTIYKYHGGEFGSNENETTHLSCATLMESIEMARMLLEICQNAIPGEYEIVKIEVLEKIEKVEQ